MARGLPSWKQQIGRRFRPIKPGSSLAGGDNRTTL